jgi:hypothetical protein
MLSWSSRPLQIAHEKLKMVQVSFGQNFTHLLVLISKDDRPKVTCSQANRKYDSAESLGTWSDSFQFPANIGAAGSRVKMLATYSWLI